MGNARQLLLCRSSTCSGPAGKLRPFLSGQLPEKPHILQAAAAADGSPLAALLLEAAVVKQVPQRKTLLGAQPHNAVFPAVFRRMVKKSPEGWNILGGHDGIGRVVLLSTNLWSISLKSGKCC